METVKSTKRGKKKYGSGKLPKLWGLLVKLHEQNPDAFRDEHYLKTVVSQYWTHLADQKHCPNCSASMAAYTRNVDYFIVSLVSAMGRIVKERVSSGIPFTEANKIHVNASTAIPHNAKNMTGISSALGLIAPVKDEAAHWAITSMGFKALRGDKVRKSVTTFRDVVIESSEETITFAEVMRDAKKKTGTEYAQNEWFHIDSFMSGSLL